MRLHSWKTKGNNHRYTGFRFFFKKAQNSYIVFTIYANQMLIPIDLVKTTHEWYKKQLYVFMSIDTQKVYSVIRHHTKTNLLTRVDPIDPTYGRSPHLNAK